MALGPRTTARQHRPKPKNGMRPSVGPSTPLGPTFRRIRLPLSAPERERFKSLGAAVTHAIEATCRNIEIGQSEQEVAGEVAHRLIKHGITPVTLSVAADGRARRHRRPVLTEKKIERECVIFTTAQRHGLHVTAAHTSCSNKPTASGQLITWRRRGSPRRSPSPLRPANFCHGCLGGRPDRRRARRQGSRMVPRTDRQRDRLAAARATDRAHAHIPIRR